MFFFVECCKRLSRAGEQRGASPFPSFSPQATLQLPLHSALQELDQPNEDVA